MLRNQAHSAAGGLIPVLYRAVPAAIIGIYLFLNRPA